MARIVEGSIGAKELNDNEIKNRDHAAVPLLMETENRPRNSARAKQALRAEAGLIHLILEYSHIQILQRDNKNNSRKRLKSNSKLP